MFISKRELKSKIDMLEIDVKSLERRLEIDVKSLERIDKAIGLILDYFNLKIVKPEVKELIIINKGKVEETKI
jgi:hypothetical protein